MKKKYKKYLSKSEKNGTNSMEFEFTEEMFYDKEVLQKINPKSLTFTDSLKFKLCPLDKTKYPDDLAGEICEICKCCEIGKECIGLKITQ